MSGVTAERSDVRNAERLIELHGSDVRYVGTWRKGLAWDGTRWVIDECGSWQRFAVDTARVMLEEAFDELRTATASADETKVKNAKAKVAWAIQAQSANRLTAMTNVARSDASIAVTHAQLDADPMLLNVANGTIDLRTGKLRPHRREDLITKLAPVAFDALAICPTWDAFMARAMASNSDLVEYVQRITGYALTGDVREHVLAFFFGGGANGKSTYLSTVHAALGDYASPAPRGLLFRSRGERHPTEFASLHGRRFVTCSEVEDGLAFDEALVKDLTGGDPIECRRMREDFWPFSPTHKLFLAGNHKPTVRGDDEGIWRRMRLVPWTVTIPEAERDPLLPAKLRAELPGILAWAVRGCLAWLSKGLDTPHAVRAATMEYRDENDGLGQFFRLHVAFDPKATIARKALREAYEGFCAENGAEPLGAKRFANRLRERGVTETKVRTPSGPRDGWAGVRPATEAEQMAAVRWSRSDVATCSEEVEYQRLARAHKETNPKSVATTHYVATGESESFAGYLGAEGIGGLK